MVKNQNLGKYRRDLHWKMYFMATWYILLPFRIFCGHLVYFVDSCYILWPVAEFCGHLLYLYGYLVCVFPFWYVVPRKIWQPCLKL
jgi:hypothetical protein